LSRRVLRGGLVFDGTGAAPFAADVAMDGNRIVGVGRVTPQRGDEVLDVTGCLVAPGLIDCHVHTLFNGMDMARIQSQPFSLQFYEAIANLRALLRSGITTVRDAGGADLGVRAAVEAGLIDGPRMAIAISVLSQTGGHVDGWNVHGDLQRLMVPHPGRPDCVVDGVDGMRKRVREILRAGADTIKVCASGGVMSTRDDPRHPQFSPAELVVCVEEAAAAGRRVMAHAHSAAGVVQAVRAGVHSIEHGVYLDDEGIELMCEHGTWLVPTLLAPVALVDAIDSGMTVPIEVERKARAITDAHLTAVRRAHAAGVRIAMGTDSGVFAHGSGPRELGLLVQAGMTPQQALRAATGSAAELLERDDVGVLEVGRFADVVVLDGDFWDFDRFDPNLRLVVADGRDCYRRG
jgi:imidazolonepropionase-like amidohydrolase